MYKEINKEIPLYKGQLVVILCDDVSELKDNSPNFPHSQIFAHSYGKEYKGEEGYFILLNTKSEQAKITQGIIAHEALHIVNILFQQRCVGYQLDNDEHACYLLEWIVDEVNNILRDANF
jgi:hypothetical protein